MSRAINYAESEMAKRVPLADIVPLEKPFAVQLAVSGICNFRCEFCPQSIPEGRAFSLEKGSGGLLDYELMRLIVDDIKKCFGKIKTIILAGAGEPLLHPRIADMVAYITNSRCAERVDVVTNGSCLTEKLGDALAGAGLSYLRISVNGLSDEDFLKYCSAKVDFRKYVDNIRYFYEHKKETKVYAKIMNYMVETPERRNQFFETFGSICDTINIENLLNTTECIDFQSITKNPEKLTWTRATSEEIVTSICSSPFYQLVIDTEGVVEPCCNGGTYQAPKPPCLGNVKETSLGDIWRKKSYPFQRKLLDGVQQTPGCDRCHSGIALVYSEDVLDGAAERLKAVYDEMLRG